MESYKLQGTDIVFSRMAMGTWGFSGASVWGESEDEVAIRTIGMALDYGVTVFDTADRYGDGRAEEVLGKAVAHRRHEAVICSKVHTAFLGYDDVIAHCEASLKRLGTDYIDVYQIHWPNPDIPVEETLSAFEKLKADGKIRAIGVCNHGVQSIQNVKGHQVVTNQLPYSLIWRLIENNSVLHDSVASGMSVWAYCPLAQGLLTGKYRTLEDVPLNRRTTRFYSGSWGQGRHNDTGFEAEIFAFLDQLRGVCDETGYTMTELALGFLKAQPCVSSILIGSRNPEQFTQNLKSFETQVPPDVIARITALSDGLKERMGTNADLWENQNGGRMY